MLAIVHGPELVLPHIKTPMYLHMLRTEPPLCSVGPTL